METRLGSERMAFDFQDEETENKLPVKKIILIVALVLCIAVPAGAIYKMTAPASDPVIVTEPTGLSKVAVNATAAVVGDTIRLSTTVGDHQSGIEIFFYQNDISIGSSFTNSEGTAIYEKIVNTAGNYIFTADGIHP